MLIKSQRVRSSIRFIFQRKPRSTKGITNTNNSRVKAAAPIRAELFNTPRRRLKLFSSIRLQTCGTRKSIFTTRHVPVYDRIFIYYPARGSSPFRADVQINEPNVIQFCNWPAVGTAMTSKNAYKDVHRGNKRAFKRSNRREQRSEFPFWREIFTADRVPRSATVENVCERSYYFV